MVFLNLSQNLQYAPALVFEQIVFNGGEPHLKIAPTDVARSTPVIITVQARRTEDWVGVLLAADALRRMGFQRLQLFIPYFPAARQDRVMVPGEPLSVKVVAGLINSAQFEAVHLFDPHSEVAPALLDNGVVYPNHAFIREVLQKLGLNGLVLVSPDAGASKKIFHLSKALGHERVVQCDKKRNPATGELLGASVHADDLQGADCLLVDDICDGGATFIQLAKALKACNAGRLYLAVSHGIFSRGFKELTVYFERVFTTNSFYKGSSDDFVEVIDLEQFIIF